jgi:hypothetical protein
MVQHETVCGGHTQSDIVLLCIVSERTHQDILNQLTPNGFFSCCQKKVDSIYTNASPCWQQDPRCASVWQRVTTGGLVSMSAKPSEASQSPENVVAMRCFNSTVFRTISFSFSELPQSQKTIAFVSQRNKTYLSSTDGRSLVRRLAQLS